MISHALVIVVNELNRHLTETYAIPEEPPQVGLGNVAEGFATGINNTGISKERLNISIVNVKEETSLKNVRHYSRNDQTLKATFENPPVFLNFQVLIAATHTAYSDALLMLSRAIRFFQFSNVFTQDSVAPLSLTKNAPNNPIDRLQTFKLIFDIYSASMEEVNHMWGTLGGKQYPFVLYRMRMLDLKFKAVQGEVGLITEIVHDVSHITTPTN